MRLPTPLTSLIGREREIAALTALLRGNRTQPTLRLVTLVGPGGVGKTRLALRVAADLAAEGHFADGTVFVDLAAVRDPGLLHSAIVQALGVRAVGQEPADAVLTTVLVNRHLLLILDNFEQIVEASSFVTDLLQACPHLSVIVTSRAVLNVAGEHVMPVPPLSLLGRASESSVPASHRTARISDAVDLFQERSRAVNPEFTLSSANEAVVASIAQRLDGLPLAIELAAARCILFSPAALLERLDHRLPQLVGGPRDQPPRHQTMRAAIAWSYDLLAPDEQAVFRCLSIFAGGCGLEAAEAVCAGHNVVAVIESLTRQSLIRIAQTSDPDGPPDGTRLVVLETVREYGLEQLAASGEEAAVRGAHARYFAALADRYALAELLPDGDRVMAMLEAEHANLRAALAWLDAAGDLESLARLADDLGRFWTGHGHYQEARAWLERILATDGAVSERVRARVLVRLGVIRMFQGASAEAETHFAEGLARCGGLDDALFASPALIGLGMMALERGDHERATTLLETAVATAQTIPDQRLAAIMTARGYANLAVVARSRGDLTLAAALCAQALRHDRDADYTPGTILSLGDLGDIARDRGDLVQACDRYREALGLVQGHLDRPLTSEAIGGMATIAAAVRQPVQAARLLGAAAALRERLGIVFQILPNQSAFAHAETVAREALGESGFAAAWAAGRGLSQERAVGEALAVDASAPPTFTLTRREHQILPLLAAGQSDREIAGALFLSLRTAENHVARLTAKLGVRSRQDAVAVARAAGLLPPADPHPAEGG